MARRLVILNVVGLTESHIGKNMPHIHKYMKQSSLTSLIPPLPAVTSTVQSSIITGTSPIEHGIVANGWHERETHETYFWRQSNDLVQGEKIWDILHKEIPEFTVANLFWWFNMYSSANISVTPRPIYCANGRKIPDIWTSPTSLRKTLQDKLGQFPLFNFWGPMANIKSTQWIVDATLEVDKNYKPTLTLVYLPHLDYPLQKFGPKHPCIAKELQAVDHEVGRLIDHFQQQGAQVCILSEYGIEDVSGAVAINQILRQNNWLEVREELGREYLDAGASDAFAVADHQVAHLYVKEKSNINTIASVLRKTDGIEFVYVGEARGELAHERCGDIVIVSTSDRWFSHDWWINESKAPDYQATVNIHAKPGYDPRELFFAKGWRGSKARIAMKLLLKKLGSHTLLDVITLDSSRVRGSHGRTPEMGAPSPILIAPTCAKKMPQSLPSAALKNLIYSWISS
mgnify:CR=1 FL=1